jgi:deazaflavin-dependent oxidoreductase (nitroreductase family)
MGPLGASDDRGGGAPHRPAPLSILDRPRIAYAAGTFKQSAEQAMAMKIDPGTPGWQQRHVELYLKSDGAEGHVLDFGRPGVPEVNCLLLQTIGRKSKAPKTTPLIYGSDGDRFVIVASKGGAPDHPAWFLNLRDQPEVRFQVADKKYRGVARIASGTERERLFRMMALLFPSYDSYQAKTAREIPVVALEPRAEIERL